MKQGAVAIIDALGFRGIWHRLNPDAVLANMRDLKSRLDHDLVRLRDQAIPLEFESAFLSDTIALSLSLSEKADKVGPHHRALAVVYVTDILTRILAWSARSPAPLAYRGAVAYGEYELSANFLIGQAVDEAASAHELAQGAIIWLMPSARDLVGQWLRTQPKNTHLVQHEVPLKGGDRLATYTVSPIVQAADEDDARRIVLALLDTFRSQSLGVAVKRQNTIQQLVQCYGWCGWTAPGELRTLPPASE